MADRNLRIRMLLEASDRFSTPLRELAGGSRRAADALKATRDRLKDMDRAQKDIAAFRELKGGLKSAEMALDAARARVTALGRELAQAEKPTRSLSAEFRRAKTEAAALERQHQQNSSRLGEVRERLRSAGIATTDLVRHERELRQEIGRTNQDLSEQGRRVQILNDRTQRLAKARAGFSRGMTNATGAVASGAAASGTAVAIAAPIHGSLDAAMEYQAGMTSIGQKTDLATDKIRVMGDAILIAARGANQLPADMQKAADSLAGLGMKPSDTVRNLVPIGKVATAYKAEIDDVAKAAFAANDNLKVPIGETTRALEVMAKAGKEGGFELADMAKEFPVLTAAAAALGQKGVGAVGDLGAALQIAFKAAGDGPTAATNVANLLQKMNAPDTIKNFEKMGVALPAALKKAYAEGKTPLEAIAELTSKTLGGDLSKIGFLFGDMQAQNALRPLIQNLEKYREIRSKAGNSKGMIETDFAKRMADSAEKVKRLQVNAAALKVTMGESLRPASDGVTDRLATLAEKMNRWSQKHPKLAKGLMIAAAALVILFGLIAIGAFAIAAIMGPIAIMNAGLLAMGVAGGLASVGLLPIIGTAAAVVAGIALLGAAAYLIYDNWDGISAFFSNLWTGIKAGFQSGVDYVGGLAGRMTEMGRNLIQGLINGVTGMLAKLKSTIVDAATSAARWFKEKLGIRSPSRVFAGFGGYMMGGLQNGIDRGAGGPVRSIDRMARRLTDAMPSAIAADSPITRVEGLGRQIATAVSIAAAVPAATPAAASVPPSGGSGAQSAGTSGNRYEIHVHAAPGMSEDQLIAKMRRVLDDRDRATAARARSTYSDSY